MLSTSIATFPADPSEVLSVGAEDIARQLLPWARGVLAERLLSVDEDEDSVFLDELDGSVGLKTGSVRFEVRQSGERVEVGAVYEPYADGDEAREYPSASPPPARLQGEAEGMESLQDWLCALI